MNYFRWDIIQDYMPFFLKGAMITVGLALSGIILGCIFGLLIAFGRMLKNKYARLPFVWYINFFRGTPLLVQILLIHYGLMPLFMKSPEPLATGVLALTLNGAAYIAEIFRSGIQSIDKGQMEAARSIGMTNVQAMRYIVLPQAFKRVIPPLGNEFIVLLKDSSLLAIISAKELMYWGNAAQGQYLRVWEPFLTVALIYLLMTLSLSRLMNFIERKVTND
jgi:glutamine transport system permease protein